MANAIKVKRGILDLIDTPAISCVASEIVNNKNAVYDIMAKWSSIALLCDGSTVLRFEYIAVGRPRF